MLIGEVRCFLVTAYPQGRFTYGDEIMEIQLTNDMLADFQNTVRKNVAEAKADGRLSSEGAEYGTDESAMDEHVVELFEDVDDAVNHLLVRIVERLIEEHPAETLVTQ